MRRRDFIRSVAVPAATGALSRAQGPAANALVELRPQEPGAVISPQIYGHFIEHLGGVIYDGVWVGRNSKIPNVDGIRKQFIDDMKRIQGPTCGGQADASPMGITGVTASGR